MHVHVRLWIFLFLFNENIIVNLFPWKELLNIFLNILSIGASLKFAVHSITEISLENTQDYDSKYLK